MPSESNNIERKIVITAIAQDISQVAEQVRKKVMVENKKDDILSEQGGKLSPAEEELLSPKP